MFFFEHAFLNPSKSQKASMLANECCKNWFCQTVFHFRQIPAGQGQSLTNVFFVQELHQDFLCKVGHTKTARLKSAPLASRKCTAIVEAQTSMVAECKFRSGLQEMTLQNRNISQTSSWLGERWSFLPWQYFLRVTLSLATQHKQGSGKGLAVSPSFLNVRQMSGKDVYKGMKIAVSKRRSEIISLSEELRQKWKLAEDEHGLLRRSPKPEYFISNHIWYLQSQSRNAIKEIRRRGFQGVLGAKGGSAGQLRTHFLTAQAWQKSWDSIKWNTYSTSGQTPIVTALFETNPWCVGKDWRCTWLCSRLLAP